jgi:hypothetical protein
MSHFICDAKCCDQKCSTPAERMYRVTMDVVIIIVTIFVLSFIFIIWHVYTEITKPIELFPKTQTRYHMGSRYVYWLGTCDPNQVKEEQSKMSLLELVSKHLSDQNKMFSEVSFKSFCDDYRNHIGIESFNETLLTDVIYKVTAKWSLWNKYNLKVQFEKHKPKIMQWMSTKNF